MFHKLLVPIDGSPTSLRAVQESAKLAAASTGVAVTLAVVIAPISSDYSDLSTEAIIRQNQAMHRHAEETLAGAASLFADYDIVPHTRILESNTASSAIAQEVQTGGFDLIVMGSRGLGLSESDRRLVGSVTENVLRRVQIPVLVIPALGK